MNAPLGHEGREITLALAGQPNVGKSTVFNIVTGLSQHVGNWPGKTVERRDGTLAHRGARLRIVDLPGTYGLSAASEEERIARDDLIRERPDAVVMVANAAALEPGAMLFVVSHEIIPETHRKGHQLPATLGVMGGFAVMMVLDNAFT